MESGLGSLILINLVFSFTRREHLGRGHIGGLIGGCLAGSRSARPTRAHARARLPGVPAPLIAWRRSPASIAVSGATGTRLRLSAALSVPPAGSRG